MSEETLETTEEASEETASDAKQTEELQQTGEAEEQTETKEEIPAWQQTGDDNDAQEVTAKVAGKLRNKFRVKLTEKDEEIQKLREEIDALKSVKTAPVATVGKMPLRDDFETDDEYRLAFEKWQDDRLATRQRATAEVSTRQAAQQREQQRLSHAVDNHVNRVAELCQTSGIEQERYIAAERQFREAIEAAVPGMGDEIADRAIDALGAGSEKVVYNVGVNPSRRAQFIQRLTEEPTGFGAFSYLGELKGKLTATASVKQTKAPPPASEAAGGTTGQGSGEAALKKKYHAAEGNAPAQRAVIKLAKEAGFDWKSW